VEFEQFGFICIRYSKAAIVFFIGTLGALVLHAFFVAFQRLPSFAERLIRKLSNDFVLSLANNFFR
jgi:hypothetical protein